MKVKINPVINVTVPYSSCIPQLSLFLKSNNTSIVFPFEAVTISPGLIPVPLIMFSQDATIKWTCILEQFTKWQTRFNAEIGKANKNKRTYRTQKEKNTHLFPSLQNIILKRIQRDREVESNNRKMRATQWLTSTPGGLICPRAFAAPRTAAEPPMSVFMISIEQPGPVLIL